MESTRQQLRGHVPEVVSKLKPVGPLAESTLIYVVIALPARNAELRTALLRDIYDPASPRFHQYLSPRQYMETFNPTEASYQSLLDFAEANRLTVVSTAPRKFIHVTAPVAVINKVFHVTLQEYQHPTEDRLFYAPAAEPAVMLETPVLHITGLDNFRTPRRAPNLLKSRGHVSGSPPHAGGSGNGGFYTGGDFRAAYAPGVTLTGKGQAVGILELDGYVESDIRMYEQKNGIPNVPLQNVYLDGYIGGSANEESAADIELVISMAPGLAKVIVYGVPYTNAGILDALNEMANPTKGEPLPYQITTSYYFFYDKNVYDALARFAVQGQALFVASGDFGSYNETTGSGAFPPADHPLVTSVGGTMLQTSGPGGAWASETVASFSGGGYSPWGSDPQFAIPWWQSGMDYTASKGSTSVRNAPDVSMVANNIDVFFNGSWIGFAGTSAGAPLWASFMALANEQAAASGISRVGFANPALWAIGRGGTGPTSFHDITTGNNFNSTNPNLYSAVPGYDLCTGWGTPNGQNLIDALVGYSVPPNRFPRNILHMMTTFDPGILNHATHDDGPLLRTDGWFPFEDVRPKVNDNRGISSAVCATSRNGDLHICAFDGTGKLLHTIRFAGGNWQPFWGDVESQETQGPDPVFNPLSAVACAVNQGGDLHVCAIGKSGKLWHTIRLADGSWQTFWDDVQSQETQGPDIHPDSAIACAVNQGGDLHVCAIGKSGKLWHTIRLADGSWQTFWGDVQSQETQGPDIHPDSAIACAVNQGGDLHVCAIGKSGKLWHTIRLADGSWQTFWGDVQSQTSLVGPLVTVPFGGVSCSTGPNDDLHVCCVTAIQGQTTDGQIWYTFRHADGRWSDFEYVQRILNVIGNALIASISHA